MREIGGPLPIELPSYRGEFYKNYESRMVRLESGRSCFEYVIRYANPKRVWLPVYNCSSVESRIKKSFQNEQKFELCFYNIKEDFYPDLPATGSDELVVWVNFWGTQPLSQREFVAQRYPLLLMDSTQAFYDPPLPNVYTAYSCRKFFGVADGAYLILPEAKKQTDNIILEKSSVAEKYSYLLRSLEYGSNAVYDEFKHCQEIFSTNPMSKMSETSKEILCRIDYQDVCMKRRRNFEVLNNALGSINQCKVSLEAGQAPFRYPFLFENELLRAHLLENHIYVARWWAETLHDSRANPFEKRLARNLLPIPLDQRYDEEDMKSVADLIKNFLRMEMD